MKCPVDQSTLMMSDKQGIEIDYCPDCRGVWLDRGELDKIVERSEVPQSTHRPEHERATEREHRAYSDDRHRSYKDDYRHDSHHKKHKKENFLGELFDF